jgi:hypothetical protein
MGEGRAEPRTAYAVLSDPSDHRERERSGVSRSEAEAQSFCQQLFMSVEILGFRFFCFFMSLLIIKSLSS